MLVIAFTTKYNEAMNERNEPETYIKDIRVAEEVAYSAKDARSAAAAIRRLNTIVSEYKEARETSSDAWPEASNRIIAAYAIYPEILSRLYGLSPAEPGEIYRRSDIRRAIGELLDLQSVPVGALPIEGSNEGEDGLNDYANTVEEVTEALTVNPPSQDFLNDFELGTQHYLGSRDRGYERVVTVQNVVELTRSRAYYSVRLQAVSSDVHQWKEFIDEKRSPEAKVNSTDSNLMRTVLNALNRVDTYAVGFGGDTLRPELNHRIATALNTETTTIADLISLFDSCTHAVMESIQAEVAKNSDIYNAVISGAAASYKSPEKTE